MVCLLAGADVVSGGRCMVLCVVALSKPLVKKCHTVEALREFLQGAWCAGVGIDIYPWLLYFCHHCILSFSHCRTVCYQAGTLRV